MRIDVFVNTFYPVAAGTETNVLETYSILVKRGWKVFVHTSNSTHTKKNILKSDGIIRGIKVFRYHIFNFFGFFPTKIDWDNTDIIAVHNLDIIPHVYIFLYVYFLKLLGRKKFALLFTPHGSFPQDRESSGRIILPIIRRIFYKTIGYFLIVKTYDGIRAISNWEKEKLTKVGIKPSLLQVIPNGIEAEAFKNVELLSSKAIKGKVKKLGNYIIQIGRISKVKNCETAIRALQYVPSNIKLVLVGPIDKQKYYEKLKIIIHDLGLDERVVFFGVAQGIDKYYLLKKALLLLHMALWESFCNVVHEAMSQGLVCVVSNRTALPDLIKHGINGYCLDPFDAKGVAEKINYILLNKNSSEIREMVWRNRKFALSHPWKKTALQMEAFYEDILAVT